MSQHAQDEFGGSEFERQASTATPGLISEIVSYLLNNKKWWLLPIVIMMLLVGALVTLGGSAAAPFIYTLF